MTGLNLLGGVLVTLTFGITVANADSYYGPRQVGDQCYRRAGHGESLGYWEKCTAGGEATSTATARTPNAATGRTSNAAIGRTSNAAKGRTTNAASGAKAKSDR